VTSSSIGVEPDAVLDPRSRHTVVSGDDGGFSSHMAPSCRGGQLDRRNGLFVGCAGADTQARAVRVTEDLALSGHGPPIPGGGLGSDRCAPVHGPPVAASARDSDRGSIEMADDSGSEAGARHDPSSLDPRPRSHHRASRWADRAASHGEQNQVRLRPGSVVSMGRSLFAPSCSSRPICSGHARAELGAWFI
jgi:hypothetical protein